MLYPTHLEEKLGFDQLKQLLRELCLSTLGQHYVDTIRFNTKFEVINRLLNQTSEFLYILNSGAAFPFDYYYNMLPALKRAKIENTWLQEEEWLQLKRSLQTISKGLEFFNRGQGQSLVWLKMLSIDIAVDTDLEKRIHFTIDDDGKVRDTASTELQRIRRALNDARSQLRKKIETLIRHSREQGYTPDDSNLTIRNGRIVIPVLAEHKRKVKGFIHDESATGQTVFIEPTEVFDLNNQVREWEYEERRELIRILTQLTDLLRPQLQPLTKAYQWLGMMDFLRAKARLAQETGATLPRFSKEQALDFRKARHPLLVLQFANTEKKVVASNIYLNSHQKVLVISGPNAGGKSVLLKTVGLLQYMLQCGLLISVEEGSEAGYFEEIFIDLGDDQSIENDLSTYSGHLTAMRHFLTLAGKKTLFLMDEFGTGTDPQFGGAIAEAVLENLVKQGAWGVVTTHYGNLKTLAERQKGIANGAMRFDKATFRPLYELEPGKPGSSFALEIAEKIGLPKKVLQEAAKKVGVNQVSLDRLLSQLETEREATAKRAKEIAEKEARLDTLLSTYAELKALLESQKKNLVKQAKAEAEMLLKDANAKIEATIKTIKEADAQKDITKAARQELESFKAEVLLEEKPTQLQPLEPPITIPIQRVQKKQTEPEQKVPQKIEVDAYIHIPDNGAYGQVISLKKNEAEVRIGGLKTFVKLNRLKRISKREFEKATGESQVIQPSKSIDLTDRMSKFSINLDIRGLRGEEAVEELSWFLDDAILLGMNELRIVHGKGDGILRQLVRNQLAKYKQISAVRDEHADRGGDGVTLVSLHA